jgi:Ser/Thr protein kinase RdoA (MazF antagonist)
MATADQLVAAAALAGAAWGIAPDSVRIISRSENVVCRVTMADGHPAVLRLHRPGYNDLKQLQSEVAWVRSLHAGGLGVPLPVATAAGDYYATVDVCGTPHHVGVIEWVAGEPLGQPASVATAPAAERYRQIGELAAAIRAHDAHWTAPDGFTRRRWDADGLVGPEPLWGRFWEVVQLTPRQRDVFAAARAQLETHLRALSTGPDRFGLIHADLHLGNLMADGDMLTVIDFDDAGFGWFAYELAVALHPVLTTPELSTLLDAIVEGYQSAHPLDHDERADIETFLVLRSLMIVGWLSARPEIPTYQHFERLAATALDLATRYLNHGTILDRA